jgi:hypothetical protein
MLAGAAGGSTKLIVPGHLLVAPGPSSSELTIAATPTCCPPYIGGPLPRWAISVYAPADFVPDLALAAGTSIGTVLDGEPAGAPITVGDPAGFVDDACARGGHAAVWTANPIFAEKRVAARVFVDPTNAEHSSYGAYRLTLCDIPFLALHLRGAFTWPTATGVYTWRAFVTPLAPSTGAPYPALTYEMRAIVPIPHLLHVTTRYVARSETLVFSGRVTAAGQPDADSLIEIAESRDVRTAISVYGTTRADGTFVLKAHVRRGRTPRTLYLDAYSFKDEPCASPSPFRGCAQRTSPATLSFTATIPKR